MTSTCGFHRIQFLLIAFVPILWNLSKGIEFYGIPHVLVIGAIGFALVGTIGLALLGIKPVSYTHLRAHETKANLVCRLLLEK